MLGIEDLKKFLDKLADIISTLKQFGYINLRLYKSSFEEEKHIIHLTGTFDTSLSINDKSDETIDEKLPKIANFSIDFLPDNSKKFNEQFIEKSDQLPLINLKEIINYFKDQLIPLSTDQENSAKTAELFHKLIAQYTDKLIKRKNSEEANSDIDDETLEKNSDKSIKRRNSGQNETLKFFVASVEPISDNPEISENQPEKEEEMLKKFLLHK